jgi:hypothetical protein
VRQGEQSESHDVLVVAEIKTPGDVPGVLSVNEANAGG